MSETETVNTTVVEAAAAPKPIARIVGGPPILKTHTLTWPVEFNGRRYELINIKRMSVAEVASFVEDLEKAEGKRVRYPMFFDTDGVPVPEEVMAAMIDDDLGQLNDAALDFLPQRFRPKPETEFAPASGSTTEPISAG